MSNILEKSDVRFSISNEGWRRLNAGRKAADLIREAISNTFDADDVTVVRVRLEAGFASIEDNSPTGISDATLVTTVFMTDKQDSATKRGRKGRGLKELISAAEWAEVDTIGFKTIFTEGRQVETSDRTIGTKVSVKVSTWTQEDIDAAVTYLTKIIPPAGLKFYINDVIVKTRQTRLSIDAHLKTQVIKNGVQQDIYRYTTVDVVNLAKGETRGWIYEMGIPVQQLTSRFHINVRQRIPLNDNRDVVDSYYLSCAYGVVLKAILPTMSAESLRHEWVDTCLSTLHEAEEQIVVRKLYGNPAKLAVAGPNEFANDVAKQNDYKLVNLNGISYQLSELVRRVVKSSEDVVGMIHANQKEEPVDESIAEPSGRLRKLIHYLGWELLGRNITTKYFKKASVISGKITVAHFDSKTGTISFNVNYHKFNDLMDPNLISTIVHEFAHNWTDIHDNYFLESVQKLSGKLAVLMLKKSDEIKLFMQGESKKMVLIQCTKCPTTRYIYPQDVHQIDKCLPCTKEARKQRAKERKIEVNNIYKAAEIK